ncbi:contractile injection system protein, VgrG/Pvc8 family [Rodentibacter sp. Ppn85]|uniref:contractile injection system protein, VgrG/Pvc8 family n=1 Tax=Rodentibacter sp. Ppn85 TaxID=1908525 RepID=UPI0018E90D92
MKALPSDWEREYCVYHETDLAFIEHLVTEEGWYYYFKYDVGEHELCFAHQSLALAVLGCLIYITASDRPFACL